MVRYRTKIIILFLFPLLLSIFILSFKIEISKQSFIIGLLLGILESIVDINKTKGKIHNNFLREQKKNKEDWIKIIFFTILVFNFINIFFVKFSFLYTEILNIIWSGSIIYCFVFYFWLVQFEKKKGKVYF